MSLVTTASRRLPASSRQMVAMSELLPVPTGPHTPSRNALVDGALVDGAGVGSGTEQPPAGAGVGLRPALDQGGPGGRDVAGRRECADLVGEVVHVGQQLEAPRGRVG